MYIVHFHGTAIHATKLNDTEMVDGYYADKQPNHHWSFTKDIMKANRYKTLKGVNDKIKHSSETLRYRNLKTQILEIEVEEKITSISNIS